MIKLDRVSWFNEEQERELEKSNIILNTKDAWEKINYPLYFSTDDLKILKDIACWREQLAIKYNVPKRWILSDSLVIKVMLANTKKPMIFYIILNSSFQIAKFKSLKIFSETKIKIKIKISLLIKILKINTVKY